MSRLKKTNLGWKGLLAAMAFTLAVLIGLSLDSFSMVSLAAQSQGKVTASSAKIRKEASASSEVVGSASKDASVTINGQVTASDNTVWYQIFVDANTLGYIRSDLVTITDGTTPTTLSSTSTASSGTTSTDTTATTTTTTTTPVTIQPTVEVTAVNPISANVANGDSVRVRADASTTSQIVTTVKSGLAVTVAGQATGADGKVWYQVNFIANGTEVSGFIRSDYLTLSGEVEPLTEGDDQENAGEQDTQEENVTTPTVTKDWDTQLDVDQWYLLDNVSGERYKIQDVFNVAENNKLMYESEHSKVKTQKAVVVILVFLLLALAGVIAYLVFKMKDMQDAAYFEQVERETIRRRTAERPSGNGQKVMHTVGTDRRPAQQRPAQQRPTQQRPTQARPTQQSQAQQSQVQPRPAQQSPAGARPVSEQPTKQSPTQQRPTQQRPAQEQATEKNPAWKSRNFMTDDDEFEFEFLNWDGEEDNL